MKLSLPRALRLARPLGVRRPIHSAVATVALIALTMACGDSTQPTAPPSVLPVIPPPAAAVPPPSPPTDNVSTIVGIYQGDNNIYAQFDSFYRGTLTSRYVLESDQTFRLQFASPMSAFEYAGKYSLTGSQITFDFYGKSSLGSWQAIARVRGDSITVMYNTVMQLNDFVDGVYVRAR